MKADLARAVEAARDVAASNATINDPLRRVAAEDPVSYALTRLAKDHAQEPGYLETLNKVAMDYRREYATRTVDALLLSGKPAEAMAALKTALDAAPDPAARAGLFDAAGKNLFTKAYFEARLGDVASAPDQGSAQQVERLGDLFRQTGEAAPPEVANALLDALRPHLKAGGDDPVARLMHTGTLLKGDAYAGLSVLVEAADSLGGQRAAEFAGLLNKQIDAVIRGGAKDNLTKWAMGEASSGLFMGMEQAVASHGATRLSAALFNEFKAHGAEPRAWQNKALGPVRTALVRGIDDFHKNTGEAVSAWAQSNQVALQFARDFGSVAPDKLAQAIEGDRKAHPDAAKAQDADRLKLEQQGLKLDKLMRGLGGMDVGGNQALGKAISSLDDDHLVQATLQGNALLQKDIVAKLTGGDVKQIRTDLQMAGTTASMVRQFKNLYAGSGAAVLNAYMQVAARQALKNPGAAWSPNSPLVAKAAHWFNADTAQVKAMFGYMEEFNAKVAGAVAQTGTGQLSDTQRKALQLEFRQGISKIEFEAADVGSPQHARNRFLRGLAASCFALGSIKNGVDAANEPGVSTSELFAGGLAAGAAADAYRGLRGVSFGGSVVAKAIMNHAIGAILDIGDVLWLAEDIASGDRTAAGLTAGVVAGDLMGWGAVAIGTQGGRAALTAALGEGMAVASLESAVPVIGLIGTAVTASCLGARFAYGVNKAKEHYEFGADDEASRRYVAMARSLGLKDGILRELLQNNRGGDEVRVKGSGWLMPVRAVQSLYESGRAFFQEGGMSPMHVLNAAFSQAGIPPKQCLQYLKSLNPQQMHRLVDKTHQILDHKMEADGKIPAPVLESLIDWMRRHGLPQQGAVATHNP